jgi:hypothetical protein
VLTHVRDGDSYESERLDQVAEELARRETHNRLALQGNLGAPYAPLDFECSDYQARLTTKMRKGRR